MTDFDADLAQIAEIEAHREDQQGYQQLVDTLKEIEDYCRQIKAESAASEGMFAAAAMSQVAATVLDIIEKAWGEPVER